MIHVKKLLMERVQVVSRLSIKRKPVGSGPLPMSPLTRMVHKAGFRHDGQQFHAVERDGRRFQGASGGEKLHFVLESAAKIRA
ncbi:MAG: hypothetical protein ABIV07_06500 [Polaromonas sp.]